MQNSGKTTRWVLNAIISTATNYYEAINIVIIAIYQCKRRILQYSSFVLVFKCTKEVMILLISPCNINFLHIYIRTQPLYKAEMISCLIINLVSTALTTLHFTID